MIVVATLSLRSVLRILNALSVLGPYHAAQGFVMTDPVFLTKSQLADIAESCGSIVIELGPLQVEEGGEGQHKYDTLYAPVFSSGIRKIRDLVSQTATGFACKDGDVRLVIAHLKRGKGKLYVGQMLMQGQPVSVEALVYSGPDGRESRCPVWPSGDELAAAFGGAAGVHLAWKPDRTRDGNLKAVWDGEGGVQKRPQYGENAERALRGEPLKAEKLPALPQGVRLPDKPRWGDGKRAVKAERDKPLPVVKPKLPVAERVEIVKKGRGGQNPPPPPPSPPAPPTPPAGGGPKPPPPTQPASPKPPAGANSGGDPPDMILTKPPGKGGGRLPTPGGGKPTESGRPRAAFPSGDELGDRKSVV